MELANAWRDSSEARDLAAVIAEKDVVFFVDSFCWTYDPRENPSLIPFDLFECQKRALRWLWDMEHRGKDAVMDKTRDMGATWLCAAYAVHRWLFRPGAAIGFGSRKLDLVDKIGDPKTIFDKIRTIIRNLPKWLLDRYAPGFNYKEHDNFCKIINPANGSTITAEGGDDIGRGARTTIYFIDEAAHLLHPLLVDQGITATSRCVIYLSTPRGANNPFAEKRLGGKYPVCTLHWKEDPRKTAWIIVPDTWTGQIDEDGELIVHDEDVHDYGLGTVDIPAIPEGWKLIYPWYEEIKAKKDPITVAQEYDIDYNASLEGVVIPARYLRACVGLQLPISTFTTAGFDVAGGGSAKNAFVERAGPVVVHMETWMGDEDTMNAAYKALEIAEARGVKRLLYDAPGVGSHMGGVFKRVGRKLKFVWSGINTGVAPTNTLWPDGRKSGEMFKNLKAELWWRLRVRAEKTFHYVEYGTYYPPDELLSLPPGPLTEQLITQLANIRYFDTEAGLIIIESKKQLADRGVASPDLADAFVLSWAPMRLQTGRTKAGGSRTQSSVQTSPTGLPTVQKADTKRKRGTYG